MYFWKFYFKNVALISTTLYNCYFELLSFILFCVVESCFVSSVISRYQVLFRVVNCYFVLSNVVLRCRVSYRMQVMSHCTFVMSHLTASILLSIAECRGFVSDPPRTSTMQSDHRQCKATLGKAKRPLTRRNDNRQSEVTPDRRSEFDKAKRHF